MRNRSAVAPAAHRGSRRGAVGAPVRGVRDAAQQGGAGSREEHVRVPVRGRAHRDPLRRRRSPAADAGRQSRVALPDSRGVRRPVFQRQHGASRQGHGPAARAATASRRGSTIASRSWRRRSSGADDGALPARRRHRHRRHGRRRRAKPRARRRRDVRAGHPAPRRRRARSGMAPRLATRPRRSHAAATSSSCWSSTRTRSKRVLFGADGVAHAAARDRVVLVSSTVDPAYVAALGAAACRAHGIALLDAPVSGGPAKAAAGTMTMMVSGDAEALAPRARCPRPHRRPRVRAGTARRATRRRSRSSTTCSPARTSRPAPRPSRSAQAAGLDLERVRDVVNASSGGSWIFADRVARALDGDLAPRAAVTLLAKDVGIAATLAERLDVDAPFARLATPAFAAAVAAGRGDDDDAVLVRLALDAAPRRGDASR